MLKLKKMKSKFLKIAFAVTIAMVNGINFYNTQKSDTLSDVALANVEALADDEDTAPGSPCYAGSYNSNFPEATKCAHPCIKERCTGVIDQCY